MRIKRPAMEGRTCWHKPESEDCCVHDEGCEHSFNQYIPFSSLLHVPFHSSSFLLLATLSFNPVFNQQMFKTLPEIDCDCTSYQFLSASPPKNPFIRLVLSVNHTPSALFGPLLIFLINPLFQHCSVLPPS